MILFVTTQQKKKREKYNPDDIFKNNRIKENKDELAIENTQMIEYKEESRFYKVIEKIKKLLLKFKKIL